jgi:hypothetical protein
MTINAGEYGIAYDLNVAYDLSNATSLLMSFTRPDGTTFSGVPVMGAVDLVTDGLGTFAAHEYCTYTFVNGDLNQPGEYFVRVAYTDSTKHLISDPTSFTVSP